MSMAQGRQLSLFDCSAAAAAAAKRTESDLNTASGSR